MAESQITIFMRIYGRWRIVHDPNLAGAKAENTPTWILIVDSPVRAFVNSAVECYSQPRINQCLYVHDRLIQEL